MKSFIAFAVLFMAALLSGCANINYGDPDRPLPPQPTVPPEIKAQLAGKPLKAFRVYTGNVVYYDASPMTDKKWMEENGSKKFALTILPKLNKPSTDTVVAAYRFIKAFRTHLQEEGYTVTNEPCAQCLRLDVDFATITINSDSLNPITFIYVSPRVFFGNIEVLKSSEDGKAFEKKGILESKESAENRLNQTAALGFTHELERAWKIVFQGEKVSMAQ